MRVRVFYLTEIGYGYGPLLTFNGNLYVSNKGMLYDDQVTARMVDMRLFNSV